MVIDKLENASLYYGLGKRFQKALEWISSVDLTVLPIEQRIEIDGDNLYATCFEQDTVPLEESKLECHKNYADIQYLISGLEFLGYSLPDTPMEPLTEYEPDIQFFKAHWDTLTVRPGTFYIVWPQDLHAPRLAYEKNGPVKVLVVKVKL